MTENNEFTPRNQNNSYQQLFYVYDVLEKQEQALQQQLSLLSSQSQGVNISKVTMEEFKNIDSEHEILLPIGSNAFTKAKLVDPKKVLVQVSSDILIEKGIEAGVESMKKMLDNYDTITKNVNQQLIEVQKRLNEIRPHIESIYQNRG